MSITFSIRLKQSLKQSVAEFEENELNDWKKQLQNILKSCHDNSKNELQDISQGLFDFIYQIQ